MSRAARSGGVLTGTLRHVHGSRGDFPTNTPRWFTDTDEGNSEWYAEHFRELAADGADLEGEARLVDAVVAPGSRILDAGPPPGLHTNIGASTPVR